MSSSLAWRFAAKERGVWGNLSQGDKKLIGQLVAITVASMIALFAAGRHAENVVLESESDLRSARVVEFLHANLSPLPDLFLRGRPTVEDSVVFRHALQAGEAFRYKLYDAQGRVVLASSPEDIGKRNTETYFDEILRTRHSFFRVDRRPSAASFADALGDPYPEGIRVVGKRGVPIMEGPRLLGVIEVYLDMSGLQQRLQGNTRWFVAGLLAMLGLVSGACAAALRRNIRDRRRAMEQLGEARHRAETLAREANEILDGLLASEEDKMSRIVGLVDGISHQIGNPLATLSMQLDELEAYGRRWSDGDFDSRLADMRAALDRVAAVLHGLTALSLEDPEIHEDADVNEIVRSLAGIVRLSDRTQGVVLSLNLPSDIASVSLPRRSVSLSLFIILTAFAECAHRAGGRIEVATAMSAAGDAVELQIAASGIACSSSASRATSTPPLPSDHPALEAARRILESAGGRMALSARTAGEHRCELVLPVSSRAASC